MDVNKRVDYIQCLLRGVAPKKYKAVLTECKELGKKLSGDQWTLRETNELTMERLWTWNKEDGIEDDVDTYLGLYKCIDSEKDCWFDLVKSM